MKIRSILSASVTAITLVAIGATVLPKAVDAVSLLWQTDNPVAISIYRLKRLDEEEYAIAIAAALEQGDYALALRLVELADSQGKTVSEEHREAAQPSFTRDMNQMLSDGATGALTGEFDSKAGLVGAIASDLSGVGDVRDLIIHGKAAIQGKDYDAIVLGLASVGVLLTGGALLTAGVASAADTGVSVIKNAYKTGQVSKPLVRSIRSSTDELIDIPRLRTELSEIETVRPARLREALETSVDFGSLEELTELSRNVGRISSQSDLNTAVKALRYAENGDDLARATRLSSHFGESTGAVFALLGRGALVAADLMFAVLSWVFTAVTWVASAIWITYRFAKTVRSIKRRARPNF